MHEAADRAGPGLQLGEQAQAVAALQRALGATLIETHISFVLLAGGQAYKIKKAVDLGFLDFSTLRQREFFSREELRLNRRTAAALYLGVLPLTGTPAQPRIGGEGAAIDWVLHMRAFDQDGLWDRMARRGRLLAAHIDAGVEALLALHRDAAVAAPGDPAGLAEQVRAPVRNNLSALQRLRLPPPERAQLEALVAWEGQAFERLRQAFDQRAHTGHVRECHADLHLGNVAQHDGRTLLFDCLEFSAALRWTDVMGDVGFMAMDLHAHGLPRLAHRFVNAYVERCGDHEGLRVLRYHQVHRALVRAQVAALRDVQGGADAAAHAGAGHAMRHYLEVALSFARPPAPVLMLTHGFSGSGKTTLTEDLLERIGAIRLRADVERKRLFGLGALARSDAMLKPRLYGDDANRATQAQLRQRATAALQGGYSVVLDATFLAHAQRQQVRAWAGGLGVPVLLLHFEASEATLRARVRQRAARGDDASEADLAVLEAQLATAQPLQDDELGSTVHIDAEAPLEAAALAAAWAPLRRRLGVDLG